MTRREIIEELRCLRSNLIYNSTMVNFASKKQRKRFIQALSEEINKLESSERFYETMRGVIK